MEALALPPPNFLTLTFYILTAFKKIQIDRTTLRGSNGVRLKKSLTENSIFWAFSLITHLKFIGNVPKQKFWVIYRFFLENVDLVVLTFWYDIDGVIAHKKLRFSLNSKCVSIKLLKNVREGLIFLFFRERWFCSTYFLPNRNCI